MSNSPEAKARRRCRKKKTFNTKQEAIIKSAVYLENGFPQQEAY